MSLNSKKWMLGILILLVLGIVAGSVVEGAIKDTVSNMGDKLKGGFGKLGDTIKNSKYGRLAVNGLALIGVGLLLATFLADKEKGAKQTGAYIGLGALGAIAAWQLHSKFVGLFLWEIAIIRDFFHTKVLVNVLIIVVIAYFIAFKWIFKAEKKPEDVGLYLLWLGIIVLAVMVARPDVPEGFTYDTMEPPYTYFWERESLADYRFFLFGDAGCEFIHADSDIEIGDETYYKQGKLWYRSDNDLPWIPEWDDKLDKDDIKKKDLDTKLVNKTAKQKADPEIKKEKYCYTRSSITQYLQTVREGKPYEPEKFPKVLREGDPYEAFGILRGTHLIMLGISFGLFWWTFKMFMKGEKEMEKVNIMMAVILAISIARANWGMESFMQFVQYYSWFLLGIMFYRQWKGVGGGG